MVSGQSGGAQAATSRILEHLTRAERALAQGARGFETSRRKRGLLAGIQFIRCLCGTSDKEGMHSLKSLNDDALSAWLTDLSEAGNGVATACLKMYKFVSQGDPVTINRLRQISAPDEAPAHDGKLSSRASGKRRTRHKPKPVPPPGQEQTIEQVQKAKTDAEIALVFSKARERNAKKKLNEVSRRETKVQEQLQAARERQNTLERKLEAAEKRLQALSPKSRAEPSFNEKIRSTSFDSLESSLVTSLPESPDTADVSRREFKPRMLSLLRQARRRRDLMRPTQTLPRMDIATTQPCQSPSSTLTRRSVASRDGSDGIPVAISEVRTITAPNQTQQLVSRVHNALNIASGALRDGKPRTNRPPRPRQMALALLACVLAAAVASNPSLLVFVAAAVASYIYGVRHQRSGTLAPTATRDLQGGGRSHASIDSLDLAGDDDEVYDVSMTSSHSNDLVTERVELVMPPHETESSPPDDDKAWTCVVQNLPCFVQDK